MTCDCRLCKRHKEYQRILTILDSMPLIDGVEQKGITQVQKFFEKIYSDLNDVEMDNDVNNSIIEGSWPTADLNIKHARERYQLTQERRQLEQDKLTMQE